LSGLTENTPQNPGGDIEIRYVGLFPGEKLHEELLTDGVVFPSEHPRIMRMKENALRPSVLDTFINCLMMACDTHERGLIEGMVKAIVTEYNPGRHAEGPAPTPASAPASAPSPAAAVGTPSPIAAPQERLALIKKFVPFRI
jgi:hypothetical protein